MSGVGSMMRPRGREAAGAAVARDVVGIDDGGCFGEGACNGARGRGIVVVLCEGRRRGFAGAGFACAGAFLGMLAD